MQQPCVTILLSCSPQVATVHSTRTIYDLPAPSPPMGLGEARGLQQPCSHTAFQLKQQHAPAISHFGVKHGTISVTEELRRITANNMTAP
jgi:hypothetical protein